MTSTTFFTFFGGRSKQTLEIIGAINGSVGATAAQSLRDRNGTAYNLAPIAVPFDCTSTTFVISNGTTNDYSIGVLVNGTQVASYTRTNSQTVEIFQDNPISLTAGDQVVLRYLGGTGSTNRPAAQLYLRED